MKTVFSPSSMVAHVWAGRTQDHGRNSQSNFYFEGNTIYSYGRHFPIARHVDHRGQYCVLLTTRKYSNTTAGHISDVRRALGGNNGPVFLVGDVTQLNHKTNLEAFRKQHIELRKKVKHARIYKDMCLNELEKAVEQANEYAKFFGLKTRFVIPDEGAIAAEVERDKKRHARELALQKKRAELWRLRRVAELQEWIKGERAYFRSNRDEEVALRVVTNENEDLLETSLGALVPLRHALKVLPLIRSGRPYERNGKTIRIGEFALDRIDEKGNVVAGCHTITREEIERVASLLKV